MKKRWHILFHRAASALGTLLVVASCGTYKYNVNRQYPAGNADIRYEGLLKECMYRSSGEGPAQRRMFDYVGLFSSMVHPLLRMGRIRQHLPSTPVVM